MNVPTNVTKSSIVTDSGSTRKPSFTWNPPAGNHDQMLRTWLRGWMSRSAKNMTPDQTNVSPDSVVAIQPDSGSPMRLPNSSSTAEPTSGSSGMIQTRSSRSRALTVWPPRSSTCARSALQEIDVVGRRALAAAEDRNDDRQSDRDLRGCDDQREEDEDLSADVVEHPREGHERQVGGVQHQLDAHEHHEDVAAQQQTDRADGEEQRGEHEVVVARHGHRAGTSSVSSAGASIGGGRWLLRRASATPPTTAMTSSTAVSSKGQRKSVNRTRATRLTLPPRFDAPPLTGTPRDVCAPVAHVPPARTSTITSAATDSRIAIGRWYGIGSCCRFSTRSTPSNMITNRNSTTIAPA